MDYRKFYQDTLKIKLGKEFVVHHIDENRSNNQMENLVHLPLELHSTYHQRKREVRELFGNHLDEIIECPSDITYKNLYQEDCLPLLIAFMQATAEVSDFIAQRDTMLYGSVKDAFCSIYEQRRRCANGNF